MDLFNTDDNQHAEGSLAAYIARHLGAESGDAPAESAGGPPESRQESTLRQASNGQYLFEQTYRSQAARSGEGGGVHINQLDTQSANGLEHLLPTPFTRFSVIKRRLDGEIEALEAQLAEYRALTGQNRFQRTREGADPALSARLEELETRLAVLKRQHAKARQALEAMRNQSSPFSQLARQFNSARQQAGSLSQQLGSAMFAPLLELTQPPEKRQSDAAWQTVQQTQHLLETEMAKPMPNPETLASLVHRHERAVTEYQSQARAYRDRAGLWQKISRNLSKPAQKPS